ncbi:ABC transporter substrate-binding protein [Paenibacillus hamazuiensis]|uniref:ABC transporter substrate-binding protein n=1 Tax=Paenibacillus hamazuiensis TaxID=2936508 RepID=UPI00200F6242|nr:sugar ABC transporter substrate-binding protein [Paenibacillus hamazuiensis]
MRSMKKSLTIAAAVVSLAVSAIGCSSNEPASGTATPGAKPADSPKAGTSGSGEKITLVYTDWANNEEAKSYRKVLDKFEETHPNIKIDYQNIPYNDYGAKLSAMAASNTLPDIGNLLEGQALKWAESGKLMDLSPYYKDGTVSPKLESNKFVTPDGKTVGYSIANEVILIHYNKDMFDEAKVPYPPAETDKAWTWDQFVDTAKKLTKDKNGKHPGEAGFDPKNIVQYGAQVNTSAMFFWIPFAVSNGGGLVSADGKQLLLGNPETVEAVQKIADLALVEHVSPTPAQSSGLPGDMGQKLLSKKVAMVISGQWELVNINPIVGKFKNGVGVLPKFKTPVTGNTGTPVAIFSTMKHPKEAVELYKYIMDPSNSQSNFDSGVWMPTEVSWYKDDALVKKWTASPVHPPEYKTAVVDYAMKATSPTPWFYLPTYNRIDEVVNPAMDAVWSGSKSAKDAIAALLPKVKPIFDSGKAN